MDLFICDGGIKITECTNRQNRLTQEQIVDKFRFARSDGKARLSSNLKIIDRRMLKGAHIHLQSTYSTGNQVVSTTFPTSNDFCDIQRATT